jgi:hypothetical protein
MLEGGLAPPQTQSDSFPDRLGGPGLLVQGQFPLPQVRRSA